MVLILVDRITERIRYIFTLIFSDLLHSPFELTTDREQFIAYQGPKLSYGKTPVSNELFLSADSILFERKISNIDLNFIEFEKQPAFFPVYHKRSALPFDPFAASFYMVSRYEEYLPYRKDEYGRFSAQESVAYQKGFLNKPVVNYWSLAIGKLISQHYPQFKYQSGKYKFISTIDIDAAWAYKQKGLFRTTGGFLNSLIKMDGLGIAERSRVLAGLEEDPFDTYEYQLSIHKKYKLNPIYFILFSEYGFNDKGISIRNRKFHSLIKSLADYAQVGIHPSFNSNFNPRKLKQEVERLSAVLNRQITMSRQHFLMIQMPTTYRNLINLDITDDYSMGFASQPGFRAGICSPFNFYDLDLDTETRLKIHPFAYMEGTLKDYLRLSPDEAMQVIRRLNQEVKAVGGTFISIWHNESLSGLKRWHGWKELYEEVIREALPNI